jgi:hypothetical protein
MPSAKVTEKPLLMAQVLVPRLLLYDLNVKEREMDESTQSILRQQIVMGENVLGVLMFVCPVIGGRDMFALMMGRIMIPRKQISVFFFRG